MNVIFLHSSRNKRTNYILHVTISYISLVITQSLILMQFYWLLYVMVQNHSRQLSITPVYVTICTMIISRVSIFHLCYWLLLIHGRKLRVQWYWRQKADLTCCSRKYKNVNKICYRSAIWKFMGGLQNIHYGYGEQQQTCLPEHRSHKRSWPNHWHNFLYRKPTHWWIEVKQRSTKTKLLTTSTEPST